MITLDKSQIDYKQLCNIKQKQIDNLNKLVLQLQETVTDLQQYLIPSKFKQGDIVNIIGMPDVLYIVDDFVCYDTSYALYNIHAVSDKEDFETVSEIDLTATTFF